MSRVDVAIAVQQDEGGRHRRLHRLLELRVGPVGVSKQLRRMAELSGHVSADVGGLGKPPASVTPRGLSPAARVSAAMAPTPSPRRRIW
jgi:hypothetical protein